MATGLMGSFTQDQVSRAYADWRSQDPTRTAADADAYGKTLGLDQGMVNNASAVYKPGATGHDTGGEGYWSGTPGSTTGGIWVPGAAPTTGAVFGGTDANGQAFTQDSLGGRTNVYDNGVQPEPTPAATPAAAAGSFNNGEALPQNAIDAARSGTKGWTAQQITAKAKELGMTPEQVAQAYGLTADDVRAGGYGSDGGIIARYRDVVWDGNSWVSKSAGGGTSTTSTTSTQTTGGGGAPGAAPAAAERYQAQGVATTPDMTIEGRMIRLMDPNDPRNQQITTQAKQIANARGVMNTSMGDSMIQDGIIKNAIAIASPDAATTAQNAQISAAANNAAGQFNASEQNKFGLQGQQAAYDKERAAIQNQYDLNKMEVNQSYDMTKLDAGQKNDLVKMSTAFGYDLNKMTAQEKADLSKMGLAQTYLRDNMGLANSFDISKMEKGAALTLAQMDAQQLHTVATLAIKQGYDVANLTSAQATQLAAAGINASASTMAASMAADARAALQLSDQNFTTLTNGSQNALGIINNLQTKFHQIQMDPNITSAEAKQAALTDATNIARSGMAVIAHSTGDASFNAALDAILL